MKNRVALFVELCRYSVPDVFIKIEAKLLRDGGRAFGVLQRGEADGGQGVAGEGVEQIGGEVASPGEGPADVVGQVLSQGGEGGGSGVDVSRGFTADGVIIVLGEAVQVIGGGVGVAGEQAVGPGAQG